MPPFLWLSIISLYSFYSFCQIENLSLSASYQVPGIIILTSFSSKTLSFNVWLDLALNGIVWLEFVNNTETSNLNFSPPIIILQMLFIPAAQITLIIINITSCVLSTLLGPMNHPAPCANYHLYVPHYVNVNNYVNGQFRAPSSLY